jgi:uncharacterized protein (TIGR03435 family)
VFDVASVKHVGSAIVVMYGPGRAESPTMNCRYNPEKVSCRLPLKDLMQEAYGVASFQVQGPDWTEAENYEVTATAPAGTAKETVRLMLRNLLADRFQLKFHREQKQIAVYVLMVAKGGPRLQEVVKPAQFAYGIKAGRTDGNLRFEGTPGIPMSAFIAYLQGPAGHPVIDQTGLTGYYAFDLEWTRDPEDRKNAGILSTLSKVGLRLESQKKIYDVLVVDSAAKEPKEN